MSSGLHPPVDLDAVNEVVLGYGERQASFVRGENRDRLHSFLFDVPRRSIVGWEVVYEHGPWLLREVQRCASPATLGRRMREPAIRPAWIQVTMLPCGYLSARQLHLYDDGVDPRGGVVDGRLEDLATICDFTVRVSHAYRGEDQGVFPPSGGGSHRILDADRVSELEATLEPAQPQRLARARRLSAVAATFALLLHGEQRDGMTGHGPYAGAAGRRLFFLEYTDLRNDFLPWAPAPDAVPLDAVSFLYELPADVEVRHDPYGSMLFDPPDFYSGVIRMQVFGRRGDELRCLSDGEMASAEAILADVRDAMYREIIEWPANMRIEYGGWLFANHLNTFVRLAGAPASVTRNLHDRAQSTSARMFEALSAVPDVPNLYRNLREPDVPLFTPVR